jgi:class 3 adenylate cyclase
MAVCAACGSENPEGQRFCGSCAAPLEEAGSGREQRKTVTVVFCDLVGSTALGESADPEAVKRLLARYFNRMRAIVESHGGTVEKFIGDAVVAVFGVPVVHEDDALRALRAAVEMREALPGLGVEGRIGVDTGEVVTSGHGTLVTGDAANVAARLEQAAQAGEILVGAATVALVSGAVEVEQLPPLELKGKSEPVVAFRLLSVGEAPERSHGSRFVGREREVAVLREAWARAVEGKRCELVTVVGEPGMGKSRLVAEFLASVDATVARSLCLSYGEGITYFPVVEVIRQLGVVPSDAAVAAAVGSLLGESDIPTSPDDISWAFRKLLEQAAPVVVVFDDIQWGEDTFLDLAEEAVLLSAAVPILIVCMARPELSERRPGWPVALRLEPLGRDAVEELLPGAAPEGLRERIARAAGGNPLFLTEMAAMAADAGQDIVVPGTLKALLAARLDRLEESERGVLERGAVEGELFHLGAVQAMEPDGAAVAPRLTALVRKELIRPERPLLPTEDGFRFCHLLIRDAAYHALPKATRAELHERFAEWLEDQSAELVERDEILGYHLQQAYRYRVELRDPDYLTRPLGERAARHLAAGGWRAVSRGDVHAVANLFERAQALGVHEPRERARILVELGDALREGGRISDSTVVLDDALEAAEALEDRGLVAMALIYRLRAQAGDPDLRLGDRQESETRKAIAMLEAVGDQRGLALARNQFALNLVALNRESEGEQQIQLAMDHADACGDPIVRRRVVGTFVNYLVGGPAPVVEIIDRCQALLPTAVGDRVLEATVKRMLGVAFVMDGRPGAGLELIDESGRVLDEANLLTISAMYRSNAAYAKELAGDRAGAEREWLARWSYFEHAASGAPDRRAAESAYRLALLYCEDERWDEAERIATRLRDVPIGGSGANARALRAMRYSLDARLAANRGRLTEAVDLAERAVAMLAESSGGGPNQAAAGAWANLAEIRHLAGDPTGAEAAAAAALELYELKGNAAAAARLRTAAY